MRCLTILSHFEQFVTLEYLEQPEFSFCLKNSCAFHLSRFITAMRCGVFSAKAYDSEFFKEFNTKLGFNHELVFFDVHLNEQTVRWMVFNADNDPDEACFRFRGDLRVRE